MVGASRCVRLMLVSALVAASAALVVAGAVGPVAGQDGAGRSGEPQVLATRVDDPITPIVADHVADVVQRGETDGFDAVLVEMDTPGGLDSSMRDIVQDFLAADVPVIVYVTPSGARAASAGALIAWSSHVVAMAPGTTIGAATPVDLSGGEVGDKVVNDAAAYARAVAEERGRDVEVAAEAVTEGRALSSSEAVEEGVADLVVEDRATLLDAVDERRVILGNGDTVNLRTGGAVVTEQSMSPLRRLIQWLADPNVVFLFLSLGTLAIIYELASPGIGAAGGLGAAMLLLAFVGLAVLPIDVAGVLFLVLAAALFVAELFAPGIGVAAALGTMSLVLAGLLLFRDEAPGLRLSLAAVVPTAVVVFAAVIVAGRLAWRARAAPSVLGAGGLVGRDVVVGRATGTVGQALVDGAWWTLRSPRPLEEGDRVYVRDVDGLDLVVEPLPGEAGPAEGVEPSPPEHKEES